MQAHTHTHTLPSTPLSSSSERQKETRIPNAPSYLPVFGNDLRKTLQGGIYTSKHGQIFSKVCILQCQSDEVNNGNNECFQLDVSPDKMFALSGNSYLFLPVLHPCIVLLRYQIKAKREGGRSKREERGECIDSLISSYLSS